MKTLRDIDVTGHTVVVREDLNVPIVNGKITGFQRIEAALPTLRYLLEKEAKIVLLSHLGRPTEGEFDAEFSLAPVAQSISTLLNVPVDLVSDCEGVNPRVGRITLLENVRFLKGEKTCDDELAKRLASVGDVFVMDAFAVAHRAQASTVGIARYAKVACAGPLLEKELSALERGLSQPKSPVVAIIGGAKVSTKFGVLENLLEKVDTLIVGGGMANTFLAAMDTPMGNSLCERDWIPKAAELMERASLTHKKILLPTDVVVAESLTDDAVTRVISPEEIEEQEAIFDVGPATQALYAQEIAAAGTIVWNGPIGVFERQPFAAGTEAIARAVAQSKAYSVAGGGDTLLAIDTFRIADDVDAISTGGGAFLEWLEGKKLPAIEALDT